MQDEAQRISHVTKSCDKIMKGGHTLVMTCDTHHLKINI